MKGSGADPGWGCSGATERVSWVVRTGRCPLCQEGNHGPGKSP